MSNSSDARIKSSRENGKRSHGPRTKEGKRRSSMNSLSHGLFSKSIVLDNERKGNFKKLTIEYHHVFGPRNGVEEGIIEGMVAADWRTRRLWALESHMLNQALPEPAPFDPETALSPTEEFAEQIGRIESSHTALSDQPKFKLLLQHEGRLHRTWLRALRALQIVREFQKKQNGENEPN